MVTVQHKGLLVTIPYKSHLENTYSSMFALVRAPPPGQMLVGCWKWQWSFLQQRSTRIWLLSHSFPAPSLRHLGEGLMHLYLLFLLNCITQNFNKSFVPSGCSSPKSQVQGPHAAGRAGVMAAVEVGKSGGSEEPQRPRAQGALQAVQQIPRWWLWEHMQIRTTRPRLPLHFQLYPSFFPYKTPPLSRHSVHIC